MAKESYEFIIGIAPSGNSFVEYEITQKEKKLMKEAMEEYEDFADCEKLQSLYRRVLAAAREKLIEDMALSDDDTDVDDLDYWVEFGEEFEEDDA